jgi:hypothetical protein
MTTRSLALLPVLACALAAAPAAAHGQDPCAHLLDDARTVRIHSTSTVSIVRGTREGLTILLEDRGCRIEARLRGEATFTADFRGIARFSPGGVFMLEEEAGGARRRLELSDDGRGGVSADYRVGRGSRAFDADAQAWFADRLLLLYRRGGLAAEERAAWLHRSAGLPALLAEAEQVRSSSARATYQVHALQQPEADDALVARVLRGSLPSSATARTRVLRAVSERGALTGVVADAYFDAVAAMSSSSRQAELLEEAIRGGRASPALLHRAVQTAGGIGSTSRRASVLGSVAEHYTFDDRLLDAYLDAVSSMASSSGRRSALRALLDSQELPDAQLARVLHAVGRITSTSARGALLASIAEERALGPRSRVAFLEVASAIPSASQRTRALDALARSERPR